MSDERLEVKWFGVVLGTASSWDQYNDNGLMFFDFQPTPEIYAASRWLEECYTLVIDPDIGEVRRFVDAEDDVGRLIPRKIFLNQLLAQIPEKDE